jgi:hypothetical protein
VLEMYVYNFLTAEIPWWMAVIVMSSFTLSTVLVLIEQFKPVKQ